MFVLGLQSSYEARSFTSRKLVSSSFHRAQSHVVSSCHGNKEAQPRAASTAIRSPMSTTLTYPTPNGRNFLISEQIFKHLRLDKIKPFPMMSYLCESNKNEVTMLSENSLVASDRFLTHVVMVHLVVCPFKMSTRTITSTTTPFATHGCQLAP